MIFHADGGFLRIYIGKCSFFFFKRGMFIFTRMSFHMSRTHDANFVRRRIPPFLCVFESESTTYSKILLWLRGHSGAQQAFSLSNAGVHEDNERDSKDTSRNILLCYAPYRSYVFFCEFATQSFSIFVLFPENVQRICIPASLQRSRGL